MDEPSRLPSDSGSQPTSPRENRFQRLRKFLTVFKNKKIALGTGLVMIMMLSIGVWWWNQGGDDVVDNQINRISRTIRPNDDGDWKRLVLPERQAPFFELGTHLARPYGISPTETLVLRAKEPISRDQVEEYLDTSTPVVVSDNGGQEFLITPVEDLGLNQVLQIRLLVKDQQVGDSTLDRDYSWAFQTQGKFRVVSHIPGDLKTDVPVNTGIELTFSQADYKDAEELIRIEPAINYRLERHEETLVIVPESPLSYSTIYTVTLEPGLNLNSRDDPITDRTQFSFQTGEPEEYKRHPYVSLSKDFIHTKTNEVAQVKVYTSNWLGSDRVEAQLYRLNSVGDFLNTRDELDEAKRNWWHYSADLSEIDTSNFELYNRFNLEVKEQAGASEYNSTRYIELPEPLPEGYYFVKLVYAQGERTGQLWIQSTNMGAYTTLGRNESVVWVNNLLSGEAVGGATVGEPGGGTFGVTNDSGVAVFSTSSQLFTEELPYLRVSHGDGEVLLPVESLNTRTKPDEKTEDDYWSYVYTERTMYKPTDDVNFWGVLVDRATDAPPGQLRAEITNGYYWGSGNVDIETGISATSDGTYQGTFELDNLPEGGYRLLIYTGDLLVDEVWFEVYEYVKPEMEISVTADKQAVFTDEKVQFKTRVEFFDGTAAKHIPLRIHNTESGDTITGETDASGQINYEFVPNPNVSSNKYTDSYRNEGLTVNPNGSYEGVIEGIARVKVFDTKVEIESEGDQSGNQATGTATVYWRDLSELNQGTGTNVRGGTIPNHTVKMTVTESWYETKEDGVYYDFIEKVTRPRVVYVRHEEVIREEDLVTTSQGKVTYSFEMKDRRSYNVKLVTLDEDGHTFDTNEYFYNYPGGSSWGGQRETTQKAYPELKLNSEEGAFSIGEEVSMSVYWNENVYPDSEKNRFLFVSANRGSIEANVFDQPTYTFGFSPEHVPNVYVGAVVFTGDSYQIAESGCEHSWYCSSYFYYYSIYGEHNFNGLNVVYEKEDSELTIALDRDKSEYLPGEAVSLEVAVTDKDSQPVANAQVQVALVDKALAAIGGVREPNILPSLYENVGNFMYYSYHTHERLFPEEPGAEMGGGGGGGVRSLFKDTAFFGTGVTGEDGKVVLEFELPDNVTTWLTYAQAVTSDLEAGQAESSVVATQDFFVSNHFPREVLKADNPAIATKANGDGLQQGEMVTFDALFMQNEREITKEQKQQEAFKEIGFGFPELELGTYDLVIKGTAGDKEDGVLLPVSVIESRLLMQMSDTQLLTKDQTLRQLTDKQIVPNRNNYLVITDEGKGKYFNSLERFYCGNSNRLEKRLSKYRANQLLDEYFEYESCTVDGSQISQFQYSDGGLALVQWGASSLPTTTWATAIDAELFDQGSLKAYFENHLASSNSGTVDKIYAAWGLTNIGEPQLISLQNLRNVATTYREKVLLGLALASAGDEEAAQNLYFDVLADYGYTFDPYIRIQADGEQTDDRLLEDAAHALLLGAMVESRYNAGLYAYLRDYRVNLNDIVLDLADIKFIETELETLPSEYTEVVFTSGVRNEERVMDRGGSWVLELTDNEVDNFSLSVEDGKAEVQSRYWINKASLSGLKADPRITITRNYKKVEGEGDDWHPGDIIQISIDVNLDKDEAPRGSYQVIDLLPSGLTYLSNPGSHGQSAKGWVYEDGHQIMKHDFSFNPRWWNNLSSSKIIYFARVSAAGEYVAEPAVVQSVLDPSVFAATNEETVTMIGN